MLLHLPLGLTHFLYIPSKIISDDNTVTINLFFVLLARGCPAAVVRLWNTVGAPDSSVPIELCGEKSPADKWQYMSESNHLRIR